MKNILILSLFIFFGHQFLNAQCHPDRHSNNWYDGWSSCEIADSPNPNRWDSHWILYNFGEPYQLAEMQIWNINDPDRLDWGMREVLIDYSLNGTDWFEWGQYEIEAASGESTYEGSQGPNLQGIMAQYILITGLNNHGGNCFGLGEIKINLDGQVATEDIIRHQNWCLAVDIFPNPFTDRANLSFNNNCNQAVSYHLTDAFGRVVNEAQFINANDQGVEALDGSNLAAGVYFLVVRQGQSLQQYKLVRL